MSLDRTTANRELILKFYQYFDDRQLDQALELLAPDFVAHLAGVSAPLDRSGFTEFGMSFYSVIGSAVETAACDAKSACAD